MPVREALHRLVADGALEYLDNRRVRVPEMGTAALHEQHLAACKRQRMAQGGATHARPLPGGREAIVHAIVKGIGIGFVSAVEYAETPGTTPITWPAASPAAGDR